MPKLNRPSLFSVIRRFARQEGGATAIEYAMIASGIAVAIATVIMSLGSSVESLYQNVATTLN